MVAGRNLDEFPSGNGDFSLSRVMFIRTKEHPLTGGFSAHQAAMPPVKSEEPYVAAAIAGSSLPKTTTAGLRRTLITLPASRKSTRVRDIGDAGIFPAGYESADASCAYTAGG